MPDIFSTIAPDEVVLSNVNNDQTIGALTFDIGGQTLAGLVDVNLANAQEHSILRKQGNTYVATNLLDAVTIGSAAAAPATFTNLTANGLLSLSSNTTWNAISFSYSNAVGSTVAVSASSLSLNSILSNLYSAADTASAAYASTVAQQQTNQNFGSTLSTLQGNIATLAPKNDPVFTGTVSGISSAMIGLGNVDNTSDENKPVSIATATALGLKANIANPTFTGVPNAPTAAVDTNTTQIATTAYAKKEADDAQAAAVQRSNHTGTQSVSTITGLGTAATSLTTDFATAAQGALAGSAAQKSANLSDLTNKPTARTNLGAAPIGNPTFQGTVNIPTCNVTFLQSYGTNVIFTYGVGSASEHRYALGLGTLATQSGTFSGTSSGTNSGDQTITLTSDVTGSGTGSFAATIATGAVSLAKMANVASSTVFYRKTAADGAPEVQSLATLKTDLGLTGTNSGDQDLSVLVPYTGATADVNLGSRTLTAGNVTGNVTGNVSGSAASFTGLLSGDVSGGQSATAISASTITGKALTGYLSAEGTIGTADTILSAIGKLNGNTALKANTASPTFTGSVTATSFVKSGGTATEFLKANGTVDTNTYLTSEADTLNSVTTRGATTTNTITVGGLVTTGNVTAGNILTNGVPVATAVDPVLTTLTGNGVLSTFSIGGAANLINPSALIVAIDGILQEPVDDYGVNNGTITFTEALADGAKAVVISPSNALVAGQVVPSDGSVTSSKIATGVTLTNPIINGTLSVGGQTQLAATQAATNASSAMTLGLGDARYFLHSTNYLTVNQTAANNANFFGASTLTTIPRITCAFLPSSIRVRACIMFNTAPVAFTTANFDFILYTTNIGNANMSTGTPLTIVPTSVTKVSGLEQYIIIAEVSTADISTKYSSAFSTYGVLSFLNGCDLRNKTGASLTTVGTNAGFIALEIYR